MHAVTSDVLNNCGMTDAPTAADDITDRVLWPRRKCYMDDNVYTTIMFELLHKRTMN